MRIILLAHQALRKFALIGLVLSPFAFTPSHAAELVGKPVPLGSQATAASSAAQTSAQSLSTPDAPVFPDEPEPPQAPDATSPNDDISHAMQELRNNFHEDVGSDFDQFNMSPDLLIPIVAMSLLFGGPVLLVIILALLHYRAKARRQNNINANIDKLLAAGRDIPVELLLGEDATAIKRNVSGEVTVYHGDNANMQKGVRNIGLGTGWLIFLTIMFGIKIGAFG
ncbi:MAG: hypothetical protein EOO68_18060, partial [Moraxellaceae bacterium]